MALREVILTRKLCHAIDSKVELGELKILVREGAKVDGVIGYRPFLHAARIGYTEAMKFLHEEGAKVDQWGIMRRPGGFGYTQAIHFATFSRDVNSTKFLLDAKADINARILGFYGYLDPDTLNGRVMFSASPVQLAFVDNRSIGNLGKQLTVRDLLLERVEWDMALKDLARFF